MEIGDLGKSGSPDRGKYGCIKDGKFCHQGERVRKREEVKGFTLDNVR